MAFFPTGVFLYNVEGEAVLSLNFKNLSAYVNLTGKEKLHQAL